MVRPAFGVGLGTSLTMPRGARMANPTNGNGEGGRESGSSDDADLSARLKSLDARLGSASAHRNDSAPRSRPTSDSRAVGQALRLSAEFVAGVIAGGAFGWLFDRLLGTSPWGLIVLLILGFFAGMLNLLRAAGMVKPSKLDEEAARIKAGGTGTDTTDQA